MRVSPFGHLRIEAYLQLPVAFRSLSRPSSAPNAKAFTLCSSSLELSYFTWFSFFFELLEFHKTNNLIRLLILFLWKGFILLFFELFSTFRWNCNLPLILLERPLNLTNLLIKSFCLCPLICSFLTLQIYFIRFSMNVYTHFHFSLSIISEERKVNSEYVSDFVAWWAQVDSNHRPRAYQARALTTWAMSPFSFSMYLVYSRSTTFFSVVGGDDGNRTHDPLLAGQVLSQLSYTPILRLFKWIVNSEEWKVKSFCWKSFAFSSSSFLLFRYSLFSVTYGHSKLNNNRFILCSSVLSSSVKSTFLYFRTNWFWSISKLTSCR